MTVVVIALVALVLLHGTSAAGGTDAGGIGAGLPGPHDPPGAPLPRPPAGKGASGGSAAGVIGAVGGAGACVAVGAAPAAPLCAAAGAWLSTSVYGAITSSGKVTCPAGQQPTGYQLPSGAALRGPFGATALIGHAADLCSADGSVPAPAPSSSAPAPAARKVVSIALPDGSSPFQGLPPNGQVTTKPPTAAVWK